jgi:hypothetical protein
VFAVADDILQSVVLTRVSIGFVSCLLTARQPREGWQYMVHDHIAKLFNVSHSYPINASK